MLAGFPRRGQGKVRLAGPEVAGFEADAEFSPHLYVEPNSTFKHAAGRRLAGIGATVIEVLAFAEVAESSANADPRRDRGGWKEIHPKRRGHKELLVVGRHHRRSVSPRIQVFIRVVNGPHFSREREQGSDVKPPGVFPVETQTFAGVDGGIEIGRSLNSLVTDESAPDDADNLVFLILRDRRDTQHHDYQQH